MNQERRVFLFGGEIPATLNSAKAYSEEILVKSKVFITPGMVFGENGVSHIRISLCGSVDLFKEAHQRIQHALKVKENRLENR